MILMDLLDSIALWLLVRVARLRAGLMHALAREVISILRNENPQREVFNQLWAVYGVMIDCTES